MMTPPPPFVPGTIPHVQHPPPPGVPVPLPPTPLTPEEMVDFEKILNDMNSSAAFIKVSVHPKQKI
jgi:hypothetical protein